MQGQPTSRRENSFLLLFLLGLSQNVLGGQQLIPLHSPQVDQSSKQATHLSYINHESVSHISDEAIHVDPEVTERQE